jgi:L-serine/L-threonine ammonia-lyase
MAITVETHRATTSKVTASGQPLTVPYPRLHTITPLVYSEGLYASSGHNIWLKLETEQLSGSFKPRGIGRSCWAAVQRLGPVAHLVAASGGNAGIAAALSARTLGVKCTVFVHDKTEQLVMDKMRSYGANVRVMDGGWERVDAGARELARTDPLAQYIHPFEGDDVVRGHASIIDEIYDQLPQVSGQRGMEDTVSRPDVVCCSVGGGGLIRGIMLGLSEHAERDGTPPTHVIGVTTFGSDSWGRSLESDDTFVTLDNPVSRAKSLVCKACSPIAVRDARIYASKGAITLDPEPLKGRSGRHLTEIRVDDAFAGAAAWQATDELNQLIELSCGVALVPAYQPSVLDHLVAKKGLAGKLNVVIVVCGGSRIDLETIEEFKATYGTGFGEIVVDGEIVQNVARP